MHVDSAQVVSRILRSNTLAFNCAYLLDCESALTGYVCDGVFGKVDSGMSPVLLIHVHF